MASHRAFDFHQLSVAERLELVEEIWDSIAADTDAETFPVSESDPALLDERLVDLRQHPDTGAPWDEVRARILGKRSE